MDHQEWFEKFNTRFRFDDGRHYEGTLAEGDGKWRAIRSYLFNMAVHTLPPLEKKIVYLIFFRGYTEREVAKKLNTSKSKVHRTKKKALKSLAKSSFVKLALSPRTLGF